MDGVVEDGTVDLGPFSWAAKIVSVVAGRAYIEKSATGTGLHAVCRGTLPEGRRQFDEPALNHTGFAFYDRPKFFTFTGRVWPQSGAISDLTQQLALLHRELFPVTPRRQNGNDRLAPENATAHTTPSRSTRVAHI